MSYAASKKRKKNIFRLDIFQLTPPRGKVKSTFFVITVLGFNQFPEFLANVVYKLLHTELRNKIFNNPLVG